ncbi:hypothetical protein TCAL_14546 [Tigriopus californicus]|uniref:MIF4G domain-containing protein n=1 Tax=Tigriopus californicus TaxID=6832 RepID=A0A553PAL3_TIGCA|nr:hypothetical protein TCAL_14546 [Tigriopus californicus]
MNNGGNPAGYGRGITSGPPPTGDMGAANGRELRRPHQGGGGVNVNDLSRNMRQMDPFNYNNGSGVPSVPRPSADGWSSGNNEYDQNYDAVPAHHRAQYQTGPGVPAAYGYQHAQRHHTPAQARLNVTANEFRPKSLSASAAEFVPRNMARNTSHWAAVQQQQHMYLDPLEEVRGGVGVLVYSPAKIDQIAEHLTNVLSAVAHDVQTLQSCVDLMVETCLVEHNFRYTGARLLDALSVGVVDQSGTQPVRTVLLSKCQSLREQHTNLKPDRRRQFILFMGDLFLHFGIYVGDHKQRMPLLGLAVIDLLTTLLSVENRKDKDNLKCVSQTLKMCGARLEEEEANSNANKDGASKTPKLDELMAVVEEVGSSPPPPGMSIYIIEMMSILVQLRKDNWGQDSNGGGVLRKMARSKSKCGSSFGDESALTKEELRFMAEQMGEPFEDDAGEDTEPEMDPEIQSAFDEFLESQGQKRS